MTIKKEKNPLREDALLEIYAEELPSSFVMPALAQMKDKAAVLLGESGLKHAGMEAWGTPRRLSLYLSSLDSRTELKEEEVTGPPVRVAYDGENRPTKAAEGFARNLGIPVADLKVKETPKGKYIYAVKSQPVLKAEDVLKDVFRKIVTGITFPKTMVWEQSRFRFARPVRCLLALYGRKVIKFSVAGVKSSNYTYGLYVTSPKKIKIPSPSRYIPLLRNNHVLVDNVFRESTIRKVLDNTLKTMKCTIKDDPALISEINFLVEHPVAVAGSYPGEYLSLPEEVLVTCMKKKQRFFPAVNSRGGIINSFVGIRNGISEHQSTVREGYERVLNASLSDAKFFVEQDTKEKLETKIPGLEGVIFHEKLGTMSDKSARVGKIARWLLNHMREIEPESAAGVTEGLVERAAKLLKADLVTNLVFEYPELQGTAGRIYALHDGENAEVARAVEEHYWPVSNEGKLPSSMTAVILALADKVDTLACDFAIGLKPTGSADPYGLRRQAIGVLRIIREKRIKVSLSELVRHALGYVPADVPAPVFGELMAFFSQRLEPVLAESGYRFDEVRAVLAAGLDDVLDAERRLDALKNIRKKPDFEPLITGFKRAGNILKQARKKKIGIEGLEINEQILKEPEEIELYRKYMMTRADVSNAGDYPDMLACLIALRKPIDGFFEKVMVMAEDESLRNNRLVLLHCIVGLFKKIGNLSLLQ